MKKLIRLVVNGEEHDLQLEANRLLLQVLRDDIGLTGTKENCLEAECGVCTVLLDGKPVRSCLLFAVQVDGAEVRTVEWLARAGELHPIQAAFHDRFALQCGYCTPGILMTVYDLLRRSPSPSREEIRRDLAGNICRCTGYQAIVDAVEDAAARLRTSPP